MRQRLPGQLTRVQRFAFQILVHVDDSESESESDSAWEGVRFRIGVGVVWCGDRLNVQVLLSWPAVCALPCKCNTLASSCQPHSFHFCAFHLPTTGVLEGEVRCTFGNNPDVSKALRALTEQGEQVEQGVPRCMLKQQC